MKLNLDPEDWKIIKNILNQYPYTFYAFGSRVHGTHKPLSDLDLCFKETIPLHMITEIRGAFEDSSLAFTVDIVNWNECSAQFKKSITPDLFELTPALK